MNIEKIEVKWLMGEVKELKRNLKRAKAVREHYKESQHTSRKYRKLDEDTHSDMMDWKSERESLEQERWCVGKTVRDREEEEEGVKKKEEL